jgi:hypothetical protein
MIRRVGIESQVRDKRQIGNPNTSNAWHGSCGSRHEEIQWSESRATVLIFMEVERAGDPGKQTSRAFAANEDTPL